MTNEIVTNQQLPGLILALEGLAVALSFSDARDSQLVGRAISCLNELKEYRKAQNPVMFIDGDISPDDLDKMAALLRECRGVTPVLIPSQSPALRDVAAERQRQQSIKGYSVEQDDTYIGGELAAAAISYIEPLEAENYWPADWHDDSFKPSDYRRNLVKATALLLAEIERLDRQEQVKNEQ
ncbi:Uncharacterised protein [Citrobacter braakii]|uniref:hypothetical protein n=1 Tax=Citrobacter braakii TaxID=57706 RepID=UPI000E068144|nr:hypothetical protein [Citrobacter braakii]STJ26705.1 Uncharacterised protein [Citrobacter braakii]